MDSTSIGNLGLSKIHLRDTQESPLLQLPAELRIKIYEYVLGNKSILIDLEREWAGRQANGTPTAKLVSNICPSLTRAKANLNVVPTRYPSFNKRENLSQQTDKPSNTFAILKVCRRINAEAKLLPFFLNVFWFNDGAAMSAWLAITGVSYNAIRAIGMSYYCDESGYVAPGLTASAALRRLRDFAALRRIEAQIAGPGLIRWNMLQLQQIIALGLRNRVGPAVEISMEWTY
ncbi:hypothetical protein EK21DRAFT_106731 [Setomelanomma holmii]|uniref:DUF7730 domain-containing protein n=1 Tax=Setomelanomma holmii TaxID=210430 RepID=A0A9P4LUM2_9PLEO|nr:hypothetical protein EK21DRAFT_106731 [Setomelanomma holmii]